MLHKSRDNGFEAPNPIRLNEISALFSLIGLHDQDEKDYRVRMIKAMDSAFLAHVAEKQRQKTSSK